MLQLYMHCKEGNIFIIDIYMVVVVIVTCDKIEDRSKEAFDSFDDR